MRHALLLSALLLPATAGATPFRQFDLPGVPITCGTAIASNGLVVGVGDTPAAMPPMIGTVSPFYLRGKVFSLPKIELPLGSIHVSGVNRWGSIVGSNFLWSSLTSENFKYYAGTVTTLGLGPPVSINDSGTILTMAQRQPPVPLSFNNIAVFQTKAGALTTIDDGTGEMFPGGMDAAADRAVGRSITANGWVAWSWHQGTFTPVVVPAATVLTSPTGVDATGRVYGTYFAGTSVQPVAHGFIQAGGTTRTWDVPHAVSTQIMASNEAGEITGCFTDAKGTHGFIAKP